MDKPLTQHIHPGEPPLDLKGFEKVGGYQAARKAVLEMSPQEVTKVVKDANLKGRGGAGFPAGMKWGFVPMGPDAPKDKYFCVNADEMEPGTFKDRVLLEGSPHQLLDSLICACYAIQASVGFIFVRWAYKKSEAALNRAIAEAREAGYIGKNIFGSDYSLEIYVHTSAGRYMAGEETGLINSVEGRRANPRAKPPYPQTCGLWGKPTVVNNVETVCCVSHIVMKGAEWFKGLSHTDDGGTKLFGVSGQVKRPGCWELPLGTTIREILFEYAGGMKDGYSFRGLLPGGASTDFLVEEHLDAQMSFSTIPKYGSRMGTGTMIILDDKSCPVGMVHNLTHFFAQESCGWCTPCRDGLPWMDKILEALEDGRGEPGDVDLLEQLVKYIGSGYTYCALAPGAAEPLGSGLKYFREDFERHIKEKRCPWRS